MFFVPGLFGGLLGLCLGFTFIAVVDVIYTFLIRLTIDVLRKKKRLAKVDKLSTNVRNDFKILPVFEGQNISHKTNTRTTSHSFELRNKNSDIWFIN